MKIMHLISGGDVGGAKTQVLTLLQELSKSHEAELVCFIEGPFAQDARAMGIRTRVLKKKGLPGQGRELLGVIRRGGFDLLHCHGSKANVFSALLRKKIGIPVISTVHSDPRLDYLGRPLANMTIGLLNRVMLRQRDGWVAVSDSIRELLIDRGYDGNRIWTNYNGIAFPDKLPHRPRGEYLKSLGIDWDENCIIYGIAARITAVKDLPTLIRAFAGTVEKAPNARLLIAGDGEQAQQLQTMAAQMCPEGTVRFIGWVSDMNSFYHCLDVNMLSSISEAFPYAIPEGARMHCATVSTAVGGVPKVVLDGETGYLVDVGDWEKMRDRMVELALDPVLRSRLGGALYEKVRREFSAEAMTNQQVDIYSRVIYTRLRRSEGRYGAIICGAYGKGNAGDEAILTTIIRQLRQQDGNLPITVMTRKPRQTAAETGVGAVHIFHFLAAGRKMRQSQLYISGGGSLIQNVTSTRSLLYYLFSIRQAKRSGCKVMMYGCGIGPVKGSGNRRRAARVIENHVDLITLRDRESAQLLAEFGVTGPEIHVTADPALVMSGDDAGALRYMERNGLNPNQKYCMFVLRPWEDAQQKLGAICTAAEYVWERYGFQPVFFSFEPNRDEAITRQAAQMVKAPCKVLSPDIDGAQLCGLIARMELVVSMRLHALIFACSQYTKVVGISYDPKVSGFMSYLGSDDCIDLSQVTERTLCDLVDNALTENYRPENVNALKAMAEENGIRAGELLRQT